MKACPQCGFAGTLSERRLLSLFREHFPDLPILEMLKRGWISCTTYSRWEARDEWCEYEIPQMLEEVLTDLMRFFQVKTVEELKEVCGWEGSLMDRNSLASSKSLPLFETPFSVPASEPPSDGIHAD